MTTLRDFEVALEALQADEVLKIHQAINTLRDFEVFNKAYKSTLYSIVGQEAGFVFCRKMRKMGDDHFYMDDDRRVALKEEEEV